MNLYKAKVLLLAQKQSKKEIKSALEIFSTNFTSDIMEDHDERLVRNLVACSSFHSR